MVSIYPNSQPTNFTHMFDFMDLKGKKKIFVDPKSILGFVENNNDFKIFNKIMRLSRYNSRFSDKQCNCTVFITPDQYILKKYSKQFIDNMDEGTATHIIKFCTMDRLINKDLLKSSPNSQFMTRNTSLRMCVSNMNNETYISDGMSTQAKIIHYNQPASNGIIHILDDLLYPVLTI